MEPLAAVYDDESDEEEDDEDYFPSNMQEVPPQPIEWHCNLPMEDSPEPTIQQDQLEPLTMLFIDECKYRMTPDKISLMSCP
jgi:hypothetical protein